MTVVGAPLLTVEHLTKHFTPRGSLLARRSTRVLKAVDDVSFSVAPGETLGLVGETGAGKSTVGRLVLRLLEPTVGRVTLSGRDVTALHGSGLRAARAGMQMVFQDPYSSLNPRKTVGSIIAAPLRIYRVPGDHRRMVQDLMARVGLSPEHYNRHPHEFSGGQRQRIGIARALALRPKLIVCDEPVSALDVSIQAQILNLLVDLQEDYGLTYLFIAHDLSVVRHIAHRIAVMYLGRIVEMSPTDALFARPQHPYTKVLLSAIPVPDPVVEAKRTRILLAGDPPSPLDPPPGCAFHTRCWIAEDRCRHDTPVLTEHNRDADHVTACHLAGQA